jgi:hypothetical protein
VKFATILNTETRHRSRKSRLDIHTGSICTRSWVSGSSPFRNKFRPAQLKPSTDSSLRGSLSGTRKCGYGWDWRCFERTPSSGCWLGIGCFLHSLRTVFLVLEKKQNLGHQNFDIKKDIHLVSTLRRPDSKYDWPRTGKHRGIWNLWLYTLRGQSMDLPIGCPECNRRVEYLDGFWTDNCKHQIDIRFLRPHNCGLAGKSRQFLEIIIWSSYTMVHVNHVEFKSKMTSEWINREKRREKAKNPQIYDTKSDFEILYGG